VVTRPRPARIFQLRARVRRSARGALALANLCAPWLYARPPAPPLPVGTVLYLARVRRPEPRTTRHSPPRAMGPGRTPTPRCRRRSGRLTRALSCQISLANPLPIPCQSRTMAAGATAPSSECCRGRSAGRHGNARALRRAQRALCMLCGLITRPNVPMLATHAPPDLRLIASVLFGWPVSDFKVLKSIGTLAVRCL
jgi:hypothetical protein